MRSVGPLEHIITRLYCIPNSICTSMFNEYVYKSLYMVGTQKRTDVLHHFTISSQGSQSIYRASKNLQGSVEVLAHDRAHFIESSGSYLKAKSFISSSLKLSPTVSTNHNKILGSVAISGVPKSF